MDSVHFKFLCAFALLGGLSWAAASDNRPVGAQPGEGVTRLGPVTVKAIPPIVEVRFVLSGQNLFEPLDDRIVKASVIAVQQGDPADGSVIQRSDNLLTINGVELRDHTLRQLAAALKGARRVGVPVWTVQRGLEVLTIQQNPSWNPALPGLKR